MFNVSTRKVGGIRFLKIGRLTFAFCLSRAYRPMKDVTPRKPVRARIEGVHLHVMERAA